MAKGVLASTLLSPTTTPQDRQQIVRMLVQRIDLNITGDTEQTEITMTGAGGFVSQHRLSRTVIRYPILAAYLHRQTIPVARVVCRHRWRSMAGEGLSGFDAELVAATGGDVLAEPVGCQQPEPSGRFSNRICVTEELRWFATTFKSL